MAAETAPNTDLVEMVLLERLLQFYDPFLALGLKTPILEKVERLVPAEHVPERRRTRRYHMPRIAHFVKQVREGQQLEPIWIDNVCEHGNITATPCVTDGHHRFAAYILLQKDLLPAVCGGRVDVIDWLTGKTPRHPEEDY